MLTSCVTGGRWVGGAEPDWLCMTEWDWSNEETSSWFCIQLGLNKAQSQFSLFKRYQGGTQRLCGILLEFCCFTFNPVPSYNLCVLLSLGFSSLRGGPLGAFLPPWSWHMPGSQVPPAAFHSCLGIEVKMLLLISRFFSFSFWRKQTPVNLCLEIILLALLTRFL